MSNTHGLGGHLGSELLVRPSDWRGDHFQKVVEFDLVPTVFKGDKFYPKKLSVSTQFLDLKSIAHSGGVGSGLQD